MRICPNCGNNVDDGVAFCKNCGCNIMNMGAAPQQPIYQPYQDPYDHTNEFSAQDVSDNKIFAMLPYLLGTIGIIISLLAINKSEYIAFHIRQSLKMTIVSILLSILTVVSAITIIGPLVCLICTAILSVIRIICFFRVCAGKSMEPPIVCKLGFLK